MLFMCIVTWDPKDDDEVSKRYAKWEWPEGIRLISEWSDLSGCRYVAVTDAESTEAYAAANLPWRDICWIDSFPVMETKELMKFVSEHMK